MTDASSAKRPSPRNSGPILGGFGLVVLLLDGHHAIQVIGDCLRNCTCGSAGDLMSFLYRLDDVTFTGLLVHLGICLMAVSAIGVAAWKMVHSSRDDD